MRYQTDSPSFNKCWHSFEICTFFLWWTSITQLNFREQNLINWHILMSKPISVRLSSEKSLANTIEPPASWEGWFLQKHSSGNSEMIYNPTYCMMIYIIYVAIHPAWVNFAARPCWPQSETRGSCTSVCTAGRGCGTFRLQSGAGPRLHCSAGWLDWFYWNKDRLSPRWVGRTLTLTAFNIIWWNKTMALDFVC